MGNAVEMFRFMSMICPRSLTSPFSFECLYQYVSPCGLGQPPDNMELGNNPPAHSGDDIPCSPGEPPLSHVGSREGRSLLRPCVLQVPPAEPYDSPRFSREIRDQMIKQCMESTKWQAAEM
ncbi:hypothetical protein GQ457_03G000630 [Hibiscus cannabinus]